MARFISGFAVGFTSVWQLTLVTLAVVPLIALAGGSYAVVMIGLTSRSQKAYSKAGEISEEVCSLLLLVGCLEFSCWGKFCYNAIRTPNVFHGGCSEI